MKVPVDLDRRVRGTWWRHVTSVDRTKPGAYALVGDFLDGAEARVPQGAILVVRRPGGESYTAEAFRVTGARSLSRFASTANWDDEYPWFRDEVAAALATGPTAAAPRSALAAVSTQQLLDAPAGPVARRTCWPSSGPAAIASDTSISPFR